MIALRWGGREVQIEVRWIGSPELQGDQRCPLVVFLHEGLGSVSAWGGVSRRALQTIEYCGPRLLTAGLWAVNAVFYRGAWGIELLASPGRGGFATAPRDFRSAARAPADFSFGAQ